jgi:cytochrome c oxidase assembly protein subunit 15
MFVVAWILMLIFIGGQVKSTESGLAVPDWPNTYGHFMFSFPWEKMVGGIFWEHLHRMVASVAGLLTFALTWWVYKADRRRWVKRIALAASIAVLVQGLLGGLTVIFLLPAWISSSHGTLAQIYLCLCVAVMLATSSRWEDAPVRTLDNDATPLRKLALVTTLAIFLQLIIGAVMRHTESGLAIPDFPTMFGSWVPPLSDARLEVANKELWKIDLPKVTFWQMVSHLAHRLWAVVVTVAAIWTSVRVFRRHAAQPLLRRPAILLLVLLTCQVTLGILTILTERQFTITSLHVVTGAATLATCMTLTIRAYHLLRLSGEGTGEWSSISPKRAEIAQEMAV